MSLPPLGMASEQHFAIPGDDTKNVVEVVRDTARQPADSFHFLDMAQTVLDPALMGDVFGDDFEIQNIALAI